MSNNRMQLIIRLENCLETILELEEDLINSELGTLLKNEFMTLKQALQKIHEISVAEIDVHRIELATDKFLSEIKTPLAHHSKPSKFAWRLLQ